MAKVPYREVAGVEPIGAVDTSQRITAPPEAFGAASAEGLRALGQGFSVVAKEFGQVAADSSFNDYQDRVKNIMYGDGKTMVPGPDGKPIIDTGFMGKKGRAAADARPEIEKQIESLQQEIRGNLLTIDQRQAFESSSRRYRAITGQQIASHAKSETDRWYGEVFDTKARLAQEQIAADPNNVASVLEAREQLRDARVSRAQLAGGGPDQIKLAEMSANQDALVAQIRAIAPTDPERAMNLVKSGQAVLGTKYDDMYAAVEGKANQKKGMRIGDSILGAQPLEAGNDTKAVIRHFEGFKEKAYQDTDGSWRVGYGSDEITRNGKIEKVGPNTVVSRDEAEADLERRAAAFQGRARDAVGAEVWNQLDDRIKASLTSITYNYGSLPSSVAEAAKKLDVDEISKAILGLSGHNGGINARRRAQEAANVRGERSQPMTQTEAIEQATNDPELRDNPTALSAAITRIGRSYEARQQTATRERAALKMRVDDSEAEAYATGTTSNPIPERDFVSNYGPAEGPERYRAYQENVMFGAKYKTMQDMPTDDIKQFVAQESNPAPATPGYARKMANAKRLQEGAEKIIKERMEDPARAVSRMPAVLAAQAAAQKNDPAAKKALIETRLQAQDQLGIPKDLQTPITKQEAKQIMRPYEMALPGLKIPALEKIGSELRDGLGEEMGAKALIYGLKAISMNAEAMRDAEGVVLALSQGRPITQTEKRQAAEGAEARAIEDALRAKAAAPKPWMEQAGDITKRVFGAATAAGTQPIPDNRAIMYLKNNPQTAATFDKTYGPGTAKKLFEEFPGFFGVQQGKGK
jgi:GH24 family phage-related lysozyme (muramidase)